MSKSSAFISYYHEDRDIGETLKEQLLFLARCGTGRDSIDTFLDVKDIPPAKDWQPIIDENLSNKDWLIVVFTGDQSVYCGYEIGTFSQLHNMHWPEKRDPDKRIMGLYDVQSSKLPVILKDRQNTFVPNVKIIVQEADKVTVSPDEVNIWFKSEVGRFLVEFCAYKGLYTPLHEIENAGTFNYNIALAAKRIANAFGVARGTDVESETPIQIGFELIVKAVKEKDSGEARLQSIPNDSVVAGTTLFFNILDLRLPVGRDQPPNTTWGELKRLLGTEGRKAPWMHKVESDVVRAANCRTASSEDVTLRGGSGKVYRPILARYKAYINGDLRFYLLFIETFDRRFVGSPRSSLLLTCLILASRWRFSYFEKWSDTTKLFGNDIPLVNFADNCRQLLYNMEWIEHESAELGTDNKKLMIDAFGEDVRARVERFFEDWKKAKQALFAIFPGLDYEITETNREEVGAGIMDFLQGSRSRNKEFLDLALPAYAAEVGQEFGNSSN